MREKLIEYVKNLFRDAEQNQKNLDLEAEILQNSLDRFDDLVAQGVPEADAYRQAVDSIGDVRQLLTEEPQTAPKKKHTARNVAIACTAVVLVLGLLAALPLVLFGINSRGSFRHESLEDRIENWADGVERDADHWAEGIEEDVEQWVNQMDEEFGYSVILPNSTYDYTGSERFSVGPAEIEADELGWLDISWMAGTVTVEVWDGDTVSITETGAETETEQVHWLLEDGRLDIQYCAAGTHLTLPRKELTVRIPNAMAEQIHALQVFGVSQDVEITGVSVEQLIFFSTSGTLNYIGGAESLQLETTSGNLNVQLAKAPDRIELDSVSGDLELTFPKGRGFEVDWDTVSGEFDCNFPGQRTDDEWVFNPEENYALRGDYEFDTVSGSVTIKKG